MDFEDQEEGPGVPVNIRIRPAMHRRLKKMGVFRRREVSWLIREAVAEFLDREEPKDDLAKENQTLNL
jgi:predicted transcriptional regulator